MNTSTEEPIIYGIDYKSSIVYNSSLLVSSSLFRVVVKEDVPPEDLIYPVSPEEEGNYHQWDHVDELIIEAPTDVIAYMTALDLGYNIILVDPY